MAKKETLRVKITSDGTHKGTHITTEDGKEVNYASFDLSMKPPRPGHYPEKGEIRAHLALMPQPIEIDIDVELRKVGQFPQVVVDDFGPSPIRVHPIVAWFAKHMDYALKNQVGGQYSGKDLNAMSNEDLARHAIRVMADALDPHAKSGTREASEAALYIAYIAAHRRDAFDRLPTEE